MAKEAAAVEGLKPELRTVMRGTLCHPLESTELFASGSKEIFIRHGNELYRLTITRNDKLILQK